MIQVHENPDVFAIEVYDPVAPVRPTNAYVVYRDGAWLLIDTGNDSPDGRDDLEQGLGELGVKRGKLSVFVTHTHVDHAGLLHRFADCPVYLGQPTDYYNSVVTSPAYWRFIRDMTLAEGVASDAAEDTASIDVNAVTRLDFPFDDKHIVPAGGTIELGDLSFTAIHAPGHTAGHMILLERNRGLLFTGDAVLPSMTPAIDMLPDPMNGFRDTLATLRKVRELPACKAFYAHYGFTGNPQERAGELIAHHETRLQEMLEVVSAHQGLTGCGLSMKRREKPFDIDDWRTLSAGKRASIIGLSLRMLHTLADEGKVIRYRGEDGLMRYKLPDSP